MPKMPKEIGGVSLPRACSAARPGRDWRFWFHHPSSVTARGICQLAYLAFAQWQVPPSHGAGTASSPDMEGRVAAAAYVGTEEVPGQVELGGLGHIQIEVGMHGASRYVR